VRLFDGSFLRDMVGIPCWVEAACAATTEAPHKRWSRRGGIPGEPLALPQWDQREQYDWQTVFKNPGAPVERFDD
jgi:hypothetical protein